MHEASLDRFEYEVDSPLNEIQQFYLEQLEPAGWLYEGLGEGVGGVFLVLRQGNIHLEISAYREPDAEHSRVILSLR